MAGAAGTEMGIPFSCECEPSSVSVGWDIAWDELFENIGKVDDGVSVAGDGLFGNSENLASGELNEVLSKISVVGVCVVRGSTDSSERAEVSDSIN